MTKKIQFPQDSCGCKYEIKTYYGVIITDDKSDDSKYLVL